MDRTISPDRTQASWTNKGLHIGLPVFAFAFILLIFARDMAQFSVPRIAFTLLAGLAFLLLPEDEDTAMLFFIIPFNTRLNFNEITLIYLLVYLLRRYKSFRLPRQTIPFFVVIVMELFNVFFASGNLMNFFRFAALMFIALLLLINPCKKENLAKIMISYVVSVALVMFDMLVLTLQHISFDTFFLMGYRFGKLLEFMDPARDFTTTNFNPNMLAAFSYTALFCLFILWYAKRLRIGGTLILGAFILFTGLLTQGRSMLLALAFFFVLIILGSMRTVKSFLVALILGMLFVGVFYLLVGEGGLLNNIYLRYVYRFEAEDVSNGRIGIWVSTLVIQARDIMTLFFGYGIRAYAASNGGSSAHNAIIESIASWGLVGFGSLLIWYYNSLKIQIRFAGVKRIPFLYFTPLIAYFFATLSEHIYTVTIMVLIFSLMQMCIRMAAFDEDRRLSKSELHKKRRAEKEEFIQERDIGTIRQGS